MTVYSCDIKGLHHNAYRCRDTEQTRSFYEGLLGLRLASALEINATKTGRPIRALHTFFEMSNQSFLSFFEIEGDGDADLFEPKSDFDLHIALEVGDLKTLMAYKEKALAFGVEVRGPSDHGFVESIYLRDPNGYVIELTVRRENHDELLERNVLEAREIVDSWQQTKRIVSASMPAAIDQR